MRPLPDEHNSPKDCDDADSCPTLCTRVRGIYLAAPLDAQARSKVQTGLLPRLYPHFMGALHRKAVEVFAHADGRPGHPGHPLHDRLQSLCEMGRCWVTVAGLYG